MFEAAPIKKVSVVIPVFNEQESLPELIRRTSAACEKLGKDYEILLIDDGSSDNSAQLMMNASQAPNSHIVSILLNRNYGQHSAIMAGFSHVTGDLIITLDADFCIRALERALSISRPEIFNSDQGVQFTSGNFTNVLERDGIRISMDGRGRAYDNIFVERLWRTVKYEEVYLHQYLTVADARRGLKRYFHFYNTERIHESLGYKTPHEIYFDKPLDRQTKQAA